MTTTLENKNTASNNNEVCTARSDAQAARNQISNQIESVKRHVFHEYQGALGDNQHLLRLALFEADILARQTGFPELLFPELAAEKAQNAARWQFRQHYLLRSNSNLALAA